MADNGATPLDSFRAQLDSARDKIGETTRKSFDGMKDSLKANPALAQGLEKTETAVKTTVSEFEEKGFCTNYKKFNEELLRPFSRMDGSKSMVAEVMGTITLKPENPKTSFVLWNVLCFWLGVVDFVLMFLFSNTVVAGALTVAAADGFAGYCFAYFFYFIFICTDKKKWMLIGFSAIAVYVLTVLILAYYALTSFNVAELVLNLLKVVANAIMGYSAYLLYKEASDPKEML